MLSFTSIKIIRSRVISALTHPECVYTAEFHLSLGAFDLKITLGFQISKSTGRSRLIQIPLPPRRVRVEPLSCLAGAILLLNTCHSMLMNNFLSANASVCPEGCFYNAMYHGSMLIFRLSHTRPASNCFQAGARVCLRTPKPYLHIKTPLARHHRVGKNQLTLISNDHVFTVE